MSEQVTRRQPVALSRFDAYADAARVHQKAAETNAFAIQAYEKTIELAPSEKRRLWTDINIAARHGIADYRAAAKHFMAAATASDAGDQRMGALESAIRCLTEAKKLVPKVDLDEEYRSDQLNDLSSNLRMLEGVRAIHTSVDPILRPRPE